MDRLTIRRSDAAADESLLTWTRNSAAPSTYFFRFSQNFNNFQGCESFKIMNRGSIQDYNDCLSLDGEFLEPVRLTTYIFRSCRSRIRLPGTARTAKNLRWPRLTISRAVNQEIDKLQGAQGSSRSKNVIINPLSPLWSPFSRLFL